MSEPALEPTISIEGAATALGMSVDWMYEKAAAGEIPSYKYGGRRRFRVSELEAWLQDQREAPRVAEVVQLHG